MTTSAFRPLTVAEQIFKDLIFSPAIKAGEIYIEGQVPFLALPIIRNLDEAAIQAITDWLYNQFVLVVDIAAIKLVNAAHQSAYDSASLDLKIIAHDKGVDSDEFKKARAKEALALSAFTQFGK